MAAAAQLLPHPLAQGVVRPSPIGHLQGELQPLMAQIKGGTGAIEHPAPTPAAVFFPLAVSAEADHAGAADQDYSIPFREGSPQRGALVARGQDSVLGERQGICQQGSGFRLQG